jgi:hypothetical protein
MYNVYQHWDPLKVCAVGASYPPEFYSYITNAKVRNVLERVAIETEEDYQKLVKLLNSFGVTTYRPDIRLDQTMLPSGKMMTPPMCPRDSTIMLGNVFHTEFDIPNKRFNECYGSDWPECPTTMDEWLSLPTAVKNEMIGTLNWDIDFMASMTAKKLFWEKMLTDIKQHGNSIIGSSLNSAMSCRVGNDLFHGTDELECANELEVNMYCGEYTNHIVKTAGHTDGSFCPVVPGLIVSLHDIQTYAETFPGWEVIYLPGQSWAKVGSFLGLKNKNRGKWWVPGEELNDDFTDYVEQWLSHWVGYVEETVFDVNMLVIDEKNVVCNNYNKEVFDAFEKRGITPHVLNFRHRYFWDGGLHCITSDIHREGTKKNYFPK